MKKITFDNNGEKMIRKWIKSDPQIKNLTLRAVKTLPQRLEEIREAIENKSFENAALKIHSLKGLALNFNLEEIYLITDKLNDEFKKEKYNLQKINSLYQELNKLVDIIPDSYL